jgi:hypothetical protein
MEKRIPYRLPNNVIGIIVWRSSDGKTLGVKVSSKRLNQVVLIENKEGSGMIESADSKG